MTNEEKKARMDQRNADICAYYVQGNKLAAVAARFKLGRQRVQQILEAGGVWKPYARSDRTAFLGVSVSRPTKEGLAQRAEREGVSVSKLASDALDALVAE